MGFKDKFRFFNIQDGQTALHLAVLSKVGGKEKIRVLLEKGADVNIWNKVSSSFWK